MNIDLDCAVAEALGYKCLDDGSWVSPPDLEWLHPKDRGRRIEQPPSFSEDLNLAWRLLDGDFAYEAKIPSVGDLPWFRIGTSAPWLAEGNSPMEMAGAICRAWLDYKGK